MPLFDFELAEIGDIHPWDAGDGARLNWYALSWGSFRIAAGDANLFEYSDHALAHFESAHRSADYQIAGFARSMLAVRAASMSPLSERIEGLANRWCDMLDLFRASRTEQVLGKYVAAGGRGVSCEELVAEAWHWLGQRAPWTGYLVGFPQLFFVRVDDEVRIIWDNREKTVEGECLWTEELGSMAMSAVTFDQECRSFAHRLLEQMDARVDLLASGRARAQAPVDIDSLRATHQKWDRELWGYFGEHSPTVDWLETERALEALASVVGVPF